MATLKYLLQSKTETSNIYLRYSLARGNLFKRKTGLIINYKDWNTEKGFPKTNRDDLKNLKSKLDKLSVFINDKFNEATGTGLEITSDWLQAQIDNYNQKFPVIELDILTNYIQKYIDDAPYKQNQKKQTGLSVGRVRNIKLFGNTIRRYETEQLKAKQILIREINLDFVEKFKLWLFGKGYSVNYVGKNIANIKTICSDASKNGIKTSSQIKSVKSISETTEPEDIIILSELEQEEISKLELKREALINARKWLLLGCLIGQRGGDLLKITNSNITEINGIKIIELKQEKTGKLVAIPLLPKAIEILDSGLPYKISLENFNDYIKDICKEANLSKLYKGRKKKKGKNSATTLGTYPMHEIVSSRVCRRSFATNFYANIPTPVLMNITAHGSEKMFLIYIGKTTYDNAYQMLEYFSKLASVPK
jgi:integrase